jgi:hypothetical protein
MPMQSLDDFLSERLAARLDALAAPPALLPPANPVRSTRKAAQWSSAVHRAYSYVSGRIRDPAQRAALDSYYAKTLEEGPDFLKVRRTAEFVPVPCIKFHDATAKEIMRQAREIERETYACRSKGKHGGGLGRMALQLLEWFCFVMWPKARYGMYPSLAHIAAGARMSKETVVEAMKALQLFGFLKVDPRRKRIETPLGVKVVQDTNCYVLNLAKGLGELTLALFRKKKQPSESTKPTARETRFYSTDQEWQQFENLPSRETAYSTA